MTQEIRTEARRIEWDAWLENPTTKSFLGAIRLLAGEREKFLCKIAVQPGAAREEGFPALCADHASRRDELLRLLDTDAVFNLINLKK